MHLRTLAFVLLASASVVADERAACLDAHARAQKLRKDGKLREARERLLVCAAPECPSLVVTDCARWRTEVDEEQPSVVISVRDDSGKDASAVRVSIDGTLLTDLLDGRPIDVDPGEHVFRYELPNGKSKESRVVVAVKEKSRPLRIDFSPTASVAIAPAPVIRDETKRGPISPLTWVIGGAGIAAAGLWATFGLVGLGHESDLKATCAPHCPSAPIGSLQREYATADIALGVAAVSLGVAAIVGLVTGLREHR